MAHDKGDLVRCSCTFTDPATGAGVSPTSVSFTFARPDGTSSTYTTPNAAIVSDGNGRFHVDVDATLAGTWSYRFTASGNYQDVITNTFLVVDAAGAAAAARLKRMIDADCAPVLTDDDVADLLVGARRNDATGNAPTSVDWTPTYDLNAAAAAGWLRKAGRAAPTVNYQTPKVTAYRAQIFDHCMAMHERFRRQARGTIATKSATREASDALEASG